MFGYPDWMDTKTVWKIIGCNSLIIIGISIGGTTLSDVSNILAKVIIISVDCILCLISGYLTRKIWIKNMHK